MAGYVEKGVIRLHEKVGHDIWRMQIELPQTAKSALPGQFIHIKINDPSKLLRRPISIAGIEPGKGGMLLTALGHWEPLFPWIKDIL